MTTIWMGRMRVEETSTATRAKQCAVEPEHTIKPRDLQVKVVHFYGRRKQNVGLVCAGCAAYIREKHRPRATVEFKAAQREARRQRKNITR